MSIADKLTTIAENEQKEITEEEYEQATLDLLTLERGGD